jgi:ABC-type multidrug transport system ATPase subunit
VTLAVSGIRVRLDGRPVLTGVAFELGDGEVLAVTGKNGTGKTTLLRVIAGVLDPDEGSVTIKGEPLRRARRHLGYVPEGADPPPHLTGAELEGLVASIRRAPPLEGALRERLGVVATRDQRIGSLSLGQRRRACLAAALVGDPWLLVLDEPTNGLDPGGVTLLSALLNERRAAGRAALVATHDFAFADAISARRLSF